MGLNGIDVLFLKEREQWRSPEDISLETKVREAVVRQGHKFEPLTLATMEETDRTAPIIFYIPYETNSFTTQKQVEGLGKRHNDSAIVLVCDTATRDSWRDTIKISNFYLLAKDSPDIQIKDLMLQLEIKYLKKSPEVPKKPSLALVLGEHTQKYKGVLEGAGYQVISPARIKRPEELGEFVAHKEDFKLILVEGKYIGMLGDTVNWNFPKSVKVGIGDAAELSVAREKEFEILYNINRDNVEKLLMNFARKHNQQRPELTSGTGHCYLLAGPTCAGKTEAGSSIKEMDPNIFFTYKHTTRKPRTDEKNGKHFQFITDQQFARRVEDNYYVTTFNMKGARYGIPARIVDLLKEGQNALMTITDPDSLPAIFEELNKRLGPNTTIPILFYADVPTLKGRLNERRCPAFEKEFRMRTLETDLQKFTGHYNRNPGLYKYVINTQHSGKERVKKILTGIVQWEDEHAGEKYVDTILKKVLPDDFIRKYVNGAPVKLHIPDEVMKAYAEEKAYNLQEFSELQNQEVVCLSKAFGCIGVYLNHWPKLQLPRLNSREISLDLIQRAIGLEPYDRNDLWDHAPVSIFGMCGDSLTKFSDGLLYMLGDDYLKQKSAGTEWYAVTFGYAKTYGRHYRAIPIDKKEKLFWDKFSDRWTKRVQ